MTSNAKSGTCIELFVRSQSASAVRPQQQAVIERLASLERRGVIDEFDVRVWGAEMCLTTASEETTCYTETIDRLEAFETWASRAGVSLDRTFQHRDRQSTVTGEDYTAIIVPVMCLVVYRDGELRCVSPHDDEAVTRTVHDVLDCLAAENSTKPVRGVTVSIDG